MTAPVLSLDSSRLHEPGATLVWTTATAGDGTALEIQSQYLLFSDESQNVATFSKVSVTGTEHVLLALTDGETYLIKLCQQISDGTLVYSNVLSVDAFSKPNPPTISSITGLDNRMDITVSHGYDGSSLLSSITFLLANGSDIFTVVRPLTYSGGSVVETSFSLTTADNPLIVNYSTFEIASFVTNAKGDSELSNAILGAPTNFPNAPQSVALAPSDQSVAMTWSLPSDFSEYSGLLPLNHQLFYKLSSVSTFTGLPLVNYQVGAPLSQTVNGLINGQSYDFKLR